MQSQIGRVPKELENLVELPSSCVHVWQWFMDLNDARLEGFSGAQPITYTEIKSYFDLHRIEPYLQDWELLLLRQFDIVYLNSKRSVQK